MHARYGFGKGICNVFKWRIKSNQQNLSGSQTHLYLRSNFTHFQSFGRTLILT